MEVHRVLWKLMEALEHLARKESANKAFKETPMIFRDLP